MKLNMKRMNSKGFTLIELLAIIVILAVILVIAVPEILDVMDSSKRSSLKDSAKSVASGWTTNIASAQLDSSNLTDNQKAIYLNWGSDWKCLTANDAAELKIDAGQYVIATGSSLNPAAPVCSMAKVENGNASVVLVVENGDQMYVADDADTIGEKKYMWAGSDGTNSWSN